MKNPPDIVQLAFDVAEAGRQTKAAAFRDQVDEAVA